MSIFDFLKHKQETKAEFDAVYKCAHSKTILVYIVTSNNVIQYKRQCVWCLQCTTGAISHKSLTKKEKQTAVLRNDKLMTERFYQRANEWAKARRESFWKYYTEYLESPEWASKRADVLERDRYTCQFKFRGCTRRAVQVHHLTYENVGNEPLEDLISVCIHCHEIVTAESRR